MKETPGRVSRSWGRARARGLHPPVRSAEPDPRSEKLQSLAAAEAKAAKAPSGGPAGSPGTQPAPPRSRPGAAGAARPHVDARARPCTPAKEAGGGLSLLLQAGGTWRPRGSYPDEVLLSKQLLLLLPRSLLLLLLLASGWCLCRATGLRLPGVSSTSCRPPLCFHL